MTIYQYPRAGFSGIIKDGVTFVPQDDTSREWQAYQEWLAGGGTPVAAGSETIDEARWRARIEVDRKAEELIQSETPVVAAGLGEVFRLREIEAAAALVDGDIQPGDYPLLEALVGTLGGTVTDVAGAIFVERDARKTWMAQVEAVRVATNADIDTAPSIVSINTTVAAAVWPTTP